MRLTPCMHGRFTCLCAATCVSLHAHVTMRIWVCGCWKHTIAWEFLDRAPCHAHVCKCASASVEAHRRMGVSGSCACHSHVCVHGKCARTSMHSHVHIHMHGTCVWLCGPWQGRMLAVALWHGTCMRMPPWVCTRVWHPPMRVHTGVVHGASSMRHG